MPPFVYQVAGGTFVVPAAAVLAVAIVTGSTARRRWVAGAGLIVALLAVTTIVISAPALPWWFDAGWGGSFLAWVCVGAGRRARLASSRSAVAAAALACTLAGGAIEVGYERAVPLPPGHASTLCVVGDSVTAGLGRRGETTWPARLRAAHGVRVVDLSRPGCTVRQAIGNAAPVAAESGIVLIEVGGNDVIGRTDPRRFGADLEALARVVRGGGRPLVMFELPRFPLDDGFGLQQRRVAKAYHIDLIPRRLFTAVLAGPGATTDGIHLSNAGQERLADLIWRIVGPGMGA